MNKETHSFPKDNNGKITNYQRGLPRILEQACDKAISVLDTFLVEMLDNADDVLFDLADKAQSNKDQSLYFSAMREVRIQRKGVEKTFAQEIRNNFHQLQAIETPSQETKLHQLHRNSMSLVQEDELEEKLAYDAMAGKANLYFSTDLRLIVKRLDTLITNHKINKSNNPLNPKAISESFHDATKPLMLDIKAKLIILKLFDRMVMSKLDEIYDCVNKFFVKEGVLPDLSRIGSAKNIQSRSKPPVSKENSENNSNKEQHIDSGVDFLGTLKSLLTEQKSTAGSVAVPGTQGTAQSPTTNSNIEQTSTDGVLSQYANSVITQTVDNTQLVKALSAIQVGSVQQPVTENAYFPVSDLRGQLASSLPISLPVTSQTVGHVNDDIIDVISLLFDFILDDDNLPDEFKILIGRLQIPILKVAVIDDTFFSKGNHPARKLLNEMAHAGVGWSHDTETGKFSLKEKVESIVTRIIDEFDDDIVIFTQSLEDFNDFTETHKNRVSLLERRLAEAEEGKAKSETAITHAKETLTKIVGNIQLPDTLHKMIFDAWQSVLSLILLREGEGSKAWKDNVNVVEALINSLILPSSLKLRKKLQNNLPELLEKLKNGLNSVGYSEFDSHNFFHELEKLHTIILKGNNVLVITSPDDKLIADENAVPLYGELPVPDVEELSRELEQIQKSTIQQAEQPENVTTGATDTENSHRENEVSDNSQGAGSYFDSSLTDNGSMLDDDSVILLVEGLQTGSWFELETDNKIMRIKLAAIISSVDKYFFVNNTGKKIAEYSKQELAMEFRRENIFQLDDGALFDRALKSIVSNFRTHKTISEE